MSKLEVQVEIDDKLALSNKDRATIEKHLSPEELARVDRERVKPGIIRAVARVAANRDERSWHYSVAYFDEQGQVVDSSILFQDYFLKREDLPAGLQTKYKEKE